MAQSQTRPSRRRSAKYRRTYQEPDSDIDVEILPAHPKSRPARSSRRIETYREPSTSSGSESSDLSLSDSDAPALSPQQSNRQIIRGPGAVRRSKRNRGRPAKRKLTQTSFSLSSFKRRKTNHSSRVEHKLHAPAVKPSVNIPVNTGAPPWQTLEYQILLKIMQYAAFPLHQSTIGWLAGVSHLCKSFHDAATAALLRDPPLLPSSRARGLLDILSQDPASLSINYRTKIRSLNIEIKPLLVKKSGIKIEELLKCTPLLSCLRIYHGHDDMIGKAIWAEPVVAHFKWSYGDLFDHLDNNNIRLKSFEWNGRFQDSLTVMSGAHHRPCMSDLEEISIVNFTFAEKQEDERIRHRDNIISSLSLLHRLKSIEFRNCNILDPTAMTQLPLPLRALTIVNCLSLTSEGVAGYLTLGGQSLHDLHLEGNQVMDLGFIPSLSETCPNLKRLFIDLSYEDCSSYRDRNPLYDELLPHGGPTWPLSLQSIIIGPLRSLDVSDAEAFYTSLINAAPDLPYLRILSIKTLLNDASWRDRATMRAKWRPIFEKVFAADKTYRPTLTMLSSEPEQSKSSKRKSARLQQLEDLSVSEDLDDGAELIPGLSTLPRQNRCEIVEFELSDQRPTQEQFREADFLDSEPSDDGEWNGTDQEAAGTGYAW